jgi:hypothetical protein
VSKANLTTGTVPLGLPDHRAESRSRKPAKESVEEPDQWTVAGQLRNLRPMYKYSFPDGQQVYLNGVTGEVA